MGNIDKTAAMAKICTINAVDGFDPAPLAVDYTDMNTSETRKRLPVMTQVAWFRLKYPEGRFTLNVVAVRDCFVATARVYKNYMDPVDCYLSEATASRGYLQDKPTVSPREWAQTAALGIALRNAGFGLQFHTAGESIEELAVNEFDEPLTPQSSVRTAEEMPLSAVPPTTQTKPGESDSSSPAETATLNESSDEDPLETAKRTPCPITKHKGKTLGDLIISDPGAIVWVANKFTGDEAISTAAKFLCEHALAVTA